MAEQENIETVHEPKLIQTAVTLCGQGRRAMEGPQGPQTHVHEGAYAIKVFAHFPNRGKLIGLTVLSQGWSWFTPSVQAWCFVMLCPAYLVVLSAHHRIDPSERAKETHSIETFRMICHMAAFAIIHSHRFHGIFICFCRFGMVYRYMT